MTYLEPDDYDRAQAQAVLDVVLAGGDSWEAVKAHFGGQEMAANNALNHAESLGLVRLLREAGTGNPGSPGTIVVTDPADRVPLEEAAERVLNRLDYSVRKNKMRLAGETALPGGVVRQALDLLAKRGQAEQVGSGMARPWLKMRPGGSGVTTRFVEPKVAAPKPASKARGADEDASGSTPEAGNGETSEGEQGAAATEPTRTQDPALRAAMERRSLDVAREYYEGLGATDYEELGKPYDIRVVVDGVERHCEVKGSSVRLDQVELTWREVEHGTDYAPMDLIVVDEIEPKRDLVSGEVTHGVGGRRRVWSNWSPEPERLKPTAYAYTLPD
jgi:hypothetical protein